MLTGTALLIVVSAAPAEAVPVKTLPGTDGANVVIRRAAHGIPHILGRSYRDVAYGYGYAFAEDNICTIANEYVTVRAERSRFFGPDAGWRFEGNSSSANNLNSDFFFQRIIDRRTVEGLLARPPPQGPRAEVKRGVAGYVAGYNRYLRKTGVDRLPDPTCRGKPWVRPIREIDAYRYFYLLAVLAGEGIAIDGIGGAQPPGPSLLSAPPAQSQSEQRRLLGELGDRFQLGALGSNAFGLGRQATVDGHGMVLGNPHFPWQGGQRFYQSQLTVPGKLDVAGAGLFGVPQVLIGHTRRLAWSHTVSPARRFTMYEEKLLPGSPTSYLLDGGLRRMREDHVTVKARAPSGRLEDRTRTLYSTEHGPITISELNLPLTPWTPLVAHSLKDVNAANFRYLNHFFETDRAQSVGQLDGILRRNQGIPWAATVAADFAGDAYYADIGVVPHVDTPKAQACSTALGVLALRLLGVPVLDGSRSACDWGSDPDSIQAGAFSPRHLPSLLRHDYVTNSNDSYWLSNPAQPLEGFPRVVGDERTPRSLRTRLGLRMVQQRLDGSDGAGGRGFTLRKLQDAVFNNRQYAGELFRDQLVALCKANPVLVGTAGPVSVSEACPVLERWNLRDDLDSRGAVLFRRFAAKVLPLPGALSPVPVNNPLAFEHPFDLADPVNTPRGLATANPQVRLALADAVDDLRSSNIPLNARLREWQYVQRGSERIPIHGGPPSLGVFNAISDRFVAGKGFPDVISGSSFVMAADMNGRRCPESRSILTYSQSANPASRYYADQTRMFSRKRWNDMRFCPEELLRDRTLRVTELGCVRDAGFRGAVRVRGGRRGLGFRFRRRVRLEVRVEIRSARGRRLRLFRRSRSFRWRGARRLPDGTFSARLTALGMTGKADRREFALTVRNGFIRVSRRPFSRRERCSLLRSASLGSPLFAAILTVRVKLARRARVTVSVLRRPRVVRRARARLGAGARRLRITTGSLRPGAYRVRIRARAGRRSAGATLYARRRGG